MEALSLFGKDLPQKMIIFVGKGGDGKSSLTKLRDSVFGGAHMHLSPEVFQVENEFRKQGVQFSSAACITVQECNGGAPLIEDIFKKFVSGEKLATRPNYGISTEYFSWSRCGKFWEMNLITPSIKGNPAEVSRMKSWTRRLVIIELGSSYTTNEDLLDVENKVFMEDSTARLIPR